MQTNLTWKKGGFSNLYRIYRADKQIGTLKDKSFNQIAYCEYEGKEYTFKTKGFFKQHTEIIDSRENTVIGKITYDSWKTKATISIDGKIINWQYNNFWNTKWSLSSEEGTAIHYAGSTVKGKIDSNADDPLLIVSGLFVTYYYWQISLAVIIAVLIPAWITVIN